MCLHILCELLRGAVIVILRALMKHRRPAQIAYIEIIQFGLVSNIRIPLKPSPQCLLAPLSSLAPPTPLQL